MLLQKGAKAPFFMSLITTKQLNVCGFSLVEVLIAMFILTFGLLGIAGLYIESLKRTEDAYWRTLATSQLIVMTEQQKTCENYTFNNTCSDLLPHGECKYENGKISVCWNRKTKKINEQCL